MPKRTHDWTKAQRMLLIRRAIENIGVADVRHIRKYLNVNHGFKDNETLRRRIYEDLNSLHEIKEIEFHHYGDGGRESDDSRRTYTLFGFEQSIIGINAIKGFGGDFFTPSKRSVPWQITNMVSLEPVQRHIKIIFQFQDNFYLLSLPKEDLPSTLVVGRVYNRQKYEFPVGDFVKAHGSRASYLGIPYGGLSVKSDSTSVGHSVLQFDIDGTVTITDLNTANYTEVATQLRTEIKPEMYGVVFNPNLPLSYKLGYWHYGLNENHKFQRINKKPLTFQTPILLRLAKDILFVIGDFAKPDEKDLNKTADQWKKMGTEMSHDIGTIMSDYFKEKKR